MQASPHRLLSNAFWESQLFPRPATGGPWMPSMIMTWLLSYSQTARNMKISLHAMILAIIFGYLHKSLKKTFRHVSAVWCPIWRDFPINHPQWLTRNRSVRTNIPSSKLIISIYHINYLSSLIITYMAIYIYGLKLDTQFQEWTESTLPWGIHLDPFPLRFWDHIIHQNTAI